MDQLQKQIFIKVKALEIALIAMIREQPDQKAYWDRLEKFAAQTLADSDLMAYPQITDGVQQQLDEWRHSIGPDPSQPYMPHREP